MDIAFSIQTHNEVKDLWDLSKLGWTEFMLPGENVEEFLKSKVSRGW